MVAARVLASALVRENKWAMALPKFGGERRGVPIVAFNRFNDEPRTEKTQVYYPDCVIVIDPRLMRFVDVFAGIRVGAILVIDSAEPVAEPLHKNLAVVGSVDAIRVGLEEIGRPITNSCMLGAFAKTTGWVQLSSIISSLEEYFSGEALRRNMSCVERGYKETSVVTFSTV